MYKDHIVKARFTDSVVMMGAIAAVIFSITLICGVGDSRLSNLMGPIVLDLQSPLARNLAVGGTFTLTAMLNLFLLGRFPLRAQIITVWCELLVLFLLFFDTFNLSYSFIATKVGFMITQGVFTTVYVSAISIAIAFVLALLGATARLSSNGFAIAIASFYTSFFRGVPLLIQIYLIYLGIPQLGYVVGAVPAGILALSLCYGAYMTEIFRAGISSISRGQWEASRAIGLTPFQTMTRVILPQSMRLIIPPTGNQFISMLKDSSLVSVIGVWELMFLARTQGRAEFRHLEMLITAAVLYWLLVHRAGNRSGTPGKTLQSRPPLTGAFDESAFRFSSLWLRIRPFRFRRCINGMATFMCSRASTCISRPAKSWSSAGRQAAANPR
jgi:polar amino acid transport system permease protein